MTVHFGEMRRLGVPEGEATLRFGEAAKAEGSWAGQRLLYLKEKPAFGLSNWCGTCPLLFERLEGASQAVSLEGLRERLASGLGAHDEEVVQTFGDLLVQGNYQSMLLTVEPTLVWPHEDADYFSHEQVATWGLNGFWGLPEYPRTPYYRTFETPVTATDAHLYEFVVPMVPPTWNGKAVVDEYVQTMARGVVPTAVAVSILDVCQPATDAPTDYYAHWGLTHFLLDGHHKMQAAAKSGQSVQVLSLLALDASLAGASELRALVALRTQPQAPRRAP